MDGSFVPFCFKYTDFRNLCNEKYKRKTIEGVEEGAYPQSCAMRMTAPSAEGAKGDFASAEAGISCLRARGGGFPIAPATPSAAHLPIDLCQER